MSMPAEDVISVAEMARRLKGAVERASQATWVEGEVTSLRRAPSGHVYFVLKDEREDAILDCVMYRFDAQRARRFLIDGARLQLLGRATVFAPRGRLQLVASRARPVGRGALLEALERLKQRLAAEGLFDPARKRPLPAEPRVVGIVTSGTGAAFHDVCTVALRRGSVRLLLCSTLVQGDGAPQSIVRALDLLERAGGIDVIIVGRGGGSGEDLMAFNDERVVRRIAAVRVPVVSAIGHEIDVTLADLAADVRAATPSQAAELVVPDFAQRRQQLARLRAHLGRAMLARLAEDRSVLTRLRAELGDPRFAIAERQQRLDELGARLERAARRAIVRQRATLGELSSRLAGRHPRAMVATARARLGPLEARLASAVRLRLASARADLGARAGRLQALSPLAVLGRGYAIVTRGDGRVLRRSDETTPGERVGVRLHHGSLEAVVTDAQEDPA
jgi:exodeoxyribonuclease VII large subunit